MGFSQTHLNGTGSSDLGDVRLLPFVGELPTDERLDMDKASEVSVPGRYCVAMSNGWVKVDVTATRRVACYEVALDESGTEWLTVKPTAFPDSLADLKTSFDYLKGIMS